MIYKNISATNTIKQPIQRGLKNQKYLTSSISMRHSKTRYWNTPHPGMRVCIMSSKRLSNQLVQCDP